MSQTAGPHSTSLRAGSSLRCASVGMTIHIKVGDASTQEEGTRVLCRKTNGTDKVAYQRTADNPNTKSRPIIEIKVSEMDQVFMVSATLMLKYSFTSQKPPSLTWEKMVDPAPVAIASSSGRTPGLCKRIGARMPAAVVKATVADPVATR